MQEENPSYYAIIPSEIRYDTNLSSSQKLLYGEITALTNKTGECWASNSYFSKLYGVAPSTVSSWVTQLKDAGYIKVRQVKKGKQTIKRIITIPTQKNEYPIQKTQRGYTENTNTPIQKTEGGSQKTEGGYSENPKENNTSNNNTSKNNTSNNNTSKNKGTEVDSFDINKIDIEELKEIRRFINNKVINPLLDETLPKESSKKQNALKYIEEDYGGFDRFSEIMGWTGWEPNQWHTQLILKNR